MSFLCPACSTKSLRIVLRFYRSIAAGMRSHSRRSRALRATLPAWRYTQKSRRGALDAEIVHHDGYRVGASDLRRLERAIKSCPVPGTRNCGCFAHRVFGRCDASGRWNGLDEIERGGMFSLER